MFQTSWRYPHYFAKIYAINLPSVVMPIIAYDGGRASPVDQQGHVVFLQWVTYMLAAASAQAIHVEAEIAAHVQVT